MIPYSLIIVNMSIPTKEQEIIYCFAGRPEEEDDVPLFIQQLEILSNLATK